MENILFLLAMVMIIGQAAASDLQMTSLRMPGIAFKGANVVLTCEFYLGYEKLYSVKWLKDGEEFFRYTPRDRPSSQYFYSEEVNVDMSRSSKNSVFLRKISLESTGVYTCEVSTDAPDFTTDLIRKHMKVIEGGISMHVPKYAKAGDNATLRCEADGGNETLYDLRWYKDDLEFFQYVPDDVPQHKAFPVKGVHLDKLNSNGMTVSILDLSIESSGDYTCKAQSKPPYFIQMQMTKRMEVLNEEPVVPGRIRISSMHVPSSVMAGDNATLRCEYDVGNETLYDLKWYKDNLEFFRYSPLSAVPLKDFPVKEVYVDRLNSNETTVSLLNIESSGDYTCKVTSDKPYFRQHEMTKRMEVLDEAS